MKILVLVKQVPDVSKVKIDPITNTIIRVGVPNIINPDDLGAVEEALKIKDSLGAKVITVTMGPPQAEGMIRELYALGVDEAYLLTAREFAGSDTLATSTILSAFIKKLAKKGKIDLILGGYQAVDGDTAQVGPQVAELLDIPQVSKISQIMKVNKKKIQVVKEYETERVVYEVEYPVLITCLSTMNTPRFMSAFNIVGSYNRGVNFVGFADLEVDQAIIGLKGSPTNVKRTFTKPSLEKAPLETLEPSEATQRILGLLKDYLGGNN
jgi:electron transfer flavoprotein beta subunit